MTKLLLLPLVAIPALALGEGSPQADKPVVKGVTIGPEGPVVTPPPSGQSQPPRNDGPQLYRLTITPAAEPVPALKYRFDVPLTGREPGNSVPLYYRALVFWYQYPRQVRAEFGDKYGRWSELREMPLDELPREEVRAELASGRLAFRELERAAVREETDWDWGLEDLSGLESINFLLPEIQDSRELARLLHLKARLEIAEGRYDDAAETLRSNYALGRAVAEPPIIINDLVGIAIIATGDQALMDWIGKEGSPNLYWALSALPDPLIDLRPALELELAIPYRFAPWLKTAATDDVPPAVWRDRFAKLMTELGEVGDLVGGPLDPSHTLMAGLALRSYPAAKQSLVDEQGYSAEAVEAMPVGKVLAVRQLFINRTIADELLKSQLVPSDAVVDVGNRVDDSLKERSLLVRPGLGKEPIPLMAMLAPAARQAAQAEWRLTTKLAGLRVIEAIRMHAAASGKLPQTLAEITVVPVPDNPTTGEPFAYRLDGETAVLDIAVKGGHPTGDWRVELTLEK